MDNIFTFHYVYDLIRLIEIFYLPDALKYIKNAAKHKTNRMSRLWISCIAL